MIRNRRLRQNQIIRDMIKDVYIDIKEFVYPLFIQEGNNIKTEIKSMPNQYRYSIDRIKEELDILQNLGIKNILLFGIPLEKDSYGSEAYNEEGVIQKAIRYIKSIYGNQFNIITDVCMCEYTSHGHCGIIENKNLNNDKTLEYLGRIALSHTKAGADIVAPSDMMDGRVKYIRDILDKNGFEYTPIMSYAVKYSSSYYGPFREAAGSTPEFGDRKSYQMDYRRKNEALNAANTAIDEGADIIIVKPALSYMDIIYKVKEKNNIPIAAYNVSAEYSMVKAASEKGWIDEKDVVKEQIYGFKRAGADIIISYFSKDIAEWLRKECFI